MTETSRGKAFALLVLAALLAGCSTTALTPSANAVSESEEAQLAASPANIASLTEVVQRNPSDPQAYNMRGAVLGLAGRHEEALQDFNKAIAIRPDTAEAYYNRGLLYQGQRQHQFATDDFSTAVGLASQQAEPLIARGLSYIA